MRRHSAGTPWATTAAAAPSSAPPLGAARSPPPAPLAETTDGSASADGIGLIGAGRPGGGLRTRHHRHPLGHHHRLGRPGHRPLRRPQVRAPSSPWLIVAYTRPADVPADPLRRDRPQPGRGRRRGGPGRGRGLLHRRLGVPVRLLADDRGDRGRVRPRLRLRRCAWPSCRPRPSPSPTWPRRSTNERVQLSIEWSLVVILVAVVAGYARRISGEADRQHSLALDRLGPPDRRQRPAVLAAPGHPDAAGLARPRRRARHHHHPPPGPVRVRLRRHLRARRHRRRLAGGAPGERPPAQPS